MDWLYYFLLLALLVCGLGIQLMNLPGLWLMAAAAGLYALITDAHYLWPWGLAIRLALCLVGELLEFISGAGGAKAAGGSKRAMIFGTIGGIAGGVLPTWGQTSLSLRCRSKTPERMSRVRAMVVSNINPSPPVRL